MRRKLTYAEMELVEAIVTDARDKLDDLADRTGNDRAHVRSVAAGGFAMLALSAGQCRSDLFAGLAKALKGRCACEIETKGTA